MVKGFEAISKRFPPLRTKNNFRNGFDARKKTFGYRSILSNQFYKPDPQPDGSDTTWHQMFRLSSTQKGWNTVIDFVKLRLGDEAAQKARKLTQLLINIMGPKSCKFICENQFMLNTYKEMRKHSHFWYKIFRADSGEAMAFDFMAYAAYRPVERMQAKQNMHDVGQALQTNALAEIDNFFS